MNNQETHDEFVVRIPKAGHEIAAVGSVLSVDLNNSPADTVLGDVAEGLGGGVLGVAVYQAALTFLTLEPEVKAGNITRAQQFKQVRATTWEASKSSMVVVTAISILLALFPALTPLAAIAAIVGGAVAGTRLVNAVMDAYSPEQKQALKDAADKAGVTIAGLNDDTSPQATAAA